MITCKYCGRKFKNLQSYYAHKCEGYINERKQIKQAKKEKDDNGDYVCNGCGRHFATAGSLKSHARFCKNYTPKNKYDESGKYISKSKYKISDSYCCECGKVFNNVQSLRAHFSHCDLHHKETGIEKKKRKHEILKCMNGWDEKTKTELQILHKKSGVTYSLNQRTGKTKNAWKGRKHTDETKRLKREDAIKYREKMIDGARAAYNINACSFIENLNKEKGWNLKHALNGGEVVLCGYYLDGYDEKLNIVFEYDEPRHYKDVYNNILSDKDIERQNFIIKELGCSFYRYNEKLKLLYEVKA